MDDQEIKAKLLKENIDCIKNPACASNFGGVWERQIRSIRSVMNGLFREHGSRLDEESLRKFRGRIHNQQQTSDCRDPQ